MPRKANRQALTPEAILQAALELIDRSGLDDFSMRRLAEALQVDAKAVYYYFPNKEAIIAGGIEQVFSELEFPEQGEMSWQEYVRQVVRLYRRVAVQHPHLFAFLTLYNKNIPVAFDIDERLAKTLLDAGFDPSAIVQIIDLLLTYIGGFALAELRGAAGRCNDYTEIYRQFQELPAERYPTIRYLSSHITPSQLRTDFDFALRILIQGIEGMLKTA
jgi:TetR/AcrR family transcriptional regulator, tetracycline repressor protein